VAVVECFLRDHPSANARTAINLFTKLADQCEHGQAALAFYTARHGTRDVSSVAKLKAGTPKLHSDRATRFFVQSIREARYASRQLPELMGRLRKALSPPTLDGFALLALDKILERIEASYGSGELEGEVQLGRDYTFRRSSTDSRGSAILEELIEAHGFKSSGAMGELLGGKMDKKSAGLLGAVAALATMSAAQATAVPPTANAPPPSYRELLNPVADALPALKADDARLAQRPVGEETRVAQISVQTGHHHHHHHGAGVRVKIGAGHRHHHHHHRDRD
jgi:hypothetical protein